MQADAAKQGEVAERLEDGAFKLATQVNVTNQAIAEPEPDDIVADVSSVNETDKSLHRAELEENWQLARNRQPLKLANRDLVLAVRSMEMSRFAIPV
jgi:hypothetical protein